jgi:hypothetical protein
MLYLGYTFTPTPHARAHEAEFWDWMQQREPWFYSGLAMVRGTSWTMEISGPQAGSIHHLVAFDDDTALARYRRALHDRAADPAWEARRVEQDQWYTITARTVHRSLPVAMGLPAGEPAAPAASRPAQAGRLRRVRLPFTRGPQPQHAP